MTVDSMRNPLERQGMLGRLRDCENQARTLDEGVLTNEDTHQTGMDEA